MKMTTVYIIIPVVVLAVVGVLLWRANQGKQTKNITETTAPTPSMLTIQTPQVSPTAAVTFGQSKKAAHFESSTPAHEDILAAVLVNVVIDFNFDLAVPSEISIKKAGKEYGQGETKIDKNKLTMRRAMDAVAPDGVYDVTYKACWPDKSCHDGAFSFAIDRSRASQHTNMTNQKEVTIRMTDILFKPMNIRLSKGTKVTWVNDDSVAHYVNTDAHPAHTYYTAQNSQTLEKGDTYAVTFNTPGVYPYHCSAHASTMVGSIVVEE